MNDVVDDGRQKNIHLAFKLFLTPHQKGRIENGIFFNSVEKNIFGTTLRR